MRLHSSAFQDQAKLAGIEYPLIGMRKILGTEERGVTSGRECVVYMTLYVRSNTLPVNCTRIDADIDTVISHTWQSWGDFWIFYFEHFAWLLDVVADQVDAIHFWQQEQWKQEQQESS